MRHFPTLLGHEIRMLLVSPSTYIAAVFFLGVMGFVFAGILDAYSKSPQEAPPAILFFRFFPIPVVCMVPLLTMRCLAEERRQGTIETLLTTPVSTTEVVLGKFGASYLLYLCLWFSTGGFFHLLSRFAHDARLLDPGPLLGGYSFIAVSGLLFIAIGVFSSSLSRNYSVAGIICFALLSGLIVGLNYLNRIPLLDHEALGNVRILVNQAQVFEHFTDFSQGVVDMRHILFYLSGTALMLILSILGVETKQLHG